MNVFSLPCSCFLLCSPPLRAGRRLVRFPHFSRRRHPFERGLPQAHHARAAAGIHGEPEVPGCGGGGQR